MTKTDLELLRTKLTIKDALIDKLVLAVGDIAEDDNVYIVSFKTPAVYKRAREFFTDNKVYYVETEEMENFFGYSVPAEESIYLTSEKEIANMAYEFKNPKFIINPPYGDLGGPIIANIKQTFPLANQAVLMPISCYKTAQVIWTDGKKYPLYQFIKTLEVVGGDGFDAVITENNCIVTLANKPNTSLTYLDIVKQTLDPVYKEIYLWNIKHKLGNSGLGMKACTDITVDKLNRDTDFVECSRCFSVKSGTGFGKGGFGYQWNSHAAEIKKNIPSSAAKLNLVECFGDEAKQAKDNITLAWYSGARKGDCLMSKLILGVRITGASGEYYFAIPQINWAHIHETQKELWDSKRYDAAILAEMGFKFDGKKYVKDVK